jgi:hypothetical protein
MELIKYSISDDLKVDCLFDKEKETIWMSQKMMSLLFGKAENTITQHIKKIINENELNENLVTRKFEITTSDGKTYNTKIYELDLILEVGFHVKSPQGIKFRKWSRDILRSYIIKGSAINETRLKEDSTSLVELQNKLIKLEEEKNKSQQLLKGMVINQFFFVL